MSLKWYLRPRLVALNSGTPVLAALVRRLTPSPLLAAAETPSGTPPPAAQFLEIVGTTIPESVSTSQMKDVRRRLPATLRRVLSDPSTAGP